MNKTQHTGSLLVEILIAVLFFGLSSTILLNVFSVTRTQSTQAGYSVAALTEAQSLADRLYLSSDPSTLLTESGYARGDDGSWILERDGYTLVAELCDEPGAAGILRRQTVRAFCNAKQILQLPCSRYLSGEVQQ